jgi:hypothetical protein
LGETCAACRAFRRGNPGDNVKLFSATLDEQAVVIAQVRLPDATTEVTQVAELLDTVDLAGSVVTADCASHTNRHRRASASA